MHYRQYQYRTEAELDHFRHRFGPIVYIFQNWAVHIQLFETYTKLQA